MDIHGLCRTVFYRLTRNDKIVIIFISPHAIKRLLTNSSIAEYIILTTHAYDRAGA
jgi:hypothetical protein